MRISLLEFPLIAQKSLFVADQNFLNFDGYNAFLKLYFDVFDNQH